MNCKSLFVITRGLCISGSEIVGSSLVQLEEYIRLNMKNRRTLNQLDIELIVFIYLANFFKTIRRIAATPIVLITRNNEMSR